MTEEQKAKIERALESVFRGGVNTVEGGVEVTDEQGGVEKLTAEGRCTCGEERCVHRMAHKFSRMIDQINNGDTQGFLRREPAEVLLAATVISEARATEERALAEAMDTPHPRASRPWVSVMEALQYHQHMERLRQEDEERDAALRKVNHQAHFAGKAFVLVLEGLGVPLIGEVFSYVYRDQHYWVTLEAHNRTATVALAEESIALAEA